VIFNQKVATHNQKVVGHNHEVVTQNQGVVVHNQKVATHNQGVVAHNQKVATHNQGVVAHNLGPQPGGGCDPQPRSCDQVGILCIKVFINIKYPVFLTTVVPVLCFIV
jgi:hypothetical protein